MTCKDWKALTPAERRAYEMGYKAAMKAQQKGPKVTATL